MNHGVLSAPPGRQTFAGTVGGTGRVLAGGAPGARSCYIHEKLVKNREYTVVATNGSLADLTGATGFTCDSSFGAAYKNVPYTFTGFETNSGTNIAVHLQIYDYANESDHHTKGVRIQLYERPGGKIVAVHDKSYYYENSYRIGDIPGVNGNDDSADGGYEVQKLHLSFGGGALSSFRDAAWTGGLTVSTGAVLFVETGNGLPSSGRIEVGGGGEIRCHAQAGYPNPVHIRPDGILNLASGSHLYSGWADSRDLFMESGILRTSAGGVNDSQSYVNHLDVLNGGTVEGNPCRVGCWVHANLWVRGNAPCYQKAGLWLSDTYPRSLTLHVEDVTSDSGPDLIISGKITGRQTSMIKTGAGTAVYSGQNSHTDCETRIDQGTLRFETDKAMGNNAMITLNGGTLDLGTGNNTQPGVGALKLTKNSTLKLSEGAIAFAISTNAWAEGATLTIEGELGKKTVRFGTNGDGLTDDQLGQIRLAARPGAPLHLDAEGWLNGNPRGTVIIFR